MSLCNVCKSIPFSRLATKRLPTVWQASSWSDVQNESDNTAWTCDKYKTTLAQLRQSSPSCALCSAIVDAVETSDTFRLAEGDGDYEGAEVPPTDFNTLWMHFLVDESRILRRDPTPMIKLFLMNDPPSDQLLRRYTRAIEFRTPFGSLMSESFPPVELENPLTDAVSKRIRAWVDECDKGHPSCLHVTQSMATLPTRLLDLAGLPMKEAMTGQEFNWHAMFLPGSCKLIETKPGQTGRYATLSYCWGAALPYVTTTKNLPSHRVSILCSQLPKTLIDAIIVCRYLEIQYIWIDCLCIVQDDKADWEYEALRMADVYSQSYLTIAAARAANCGEGFLGPRQLPPTRAAKIQDDYGTYDLYFVASPRYEDIPIEPLDTRSWVMQEVYLSPRVLRFKSDGLSWDCSIRDNEGRHIDYVLASTAFKLQTTADWLRTPTEPLIGSSPWDLIIRNYTSRQLTYPSDKFPALAGVVTVLERLTGDTCYAGLWKQKFLACLLWRRTYRVGKLPKQPDAWRAPSWSFAAFEGDVGYITPSFQSQNKQRIYCAKFEECSLTPKGHNPLGELRTGFVRLSGPILSPEFLSTRSTRNSTDIYRISLCDRSSWELQVKFDTRTHQDIEILMITNYEGLAIKKAHVERDEYIRIGLAEVLRRFHSTDVEKIAFLDQSNNNLVLERALQTSDYPESRSIILV